MPREEPECHSFDESVITEYDRSVADYYGRPHLLVTIDDMLRGAGKNPEAPTVEDLAPFD